MGKKLKDEKSREDKAVTNCNRHNFTNENVSDLRVKLLTWYDGEARTLPWRSAARPGDPAFIEDDDRRGYGTWVSEVMLQQTQVSTVIQYYKNWMSRWPTLEDLAAASLDDVNKVWSGLGYYSRARRLQEGAVKVIKEMNGRMPRTVSDLLLLPGVGRYTAGAVASIAFGEVSGLVDGNVMRVMSRLRTVGPGEGTQAADKIWQLAEQVVDPVRPGDFNQAVMELGAVVCSPKNPSCDTCPAVSVCGARQQKGQTDIEDCGLCLKDWNPDLSVTNYPRKVKKTSSRDEVTLVLVASRQAEDLEKLAMVQRPKTGLLANLLEFLNIVLKEESKEVPLLKGLVSSKGLKLVGDMRRVGDVVHVFSHINMKYVVYQGEVEIEVEDSSLKWLSREEFEESGTSTAMKKVFKAVQGLCDAGGKKRKRVEDDKQPNINSFFQVKVKKEKLS